MTHSPNVIPSADELRRAATEMRRWAQQATPGRWKLWGMDVLADQDGSSNVDAATPVAHTYYRDEHGKPRTFDAEHIASWHPAVALAVADWLDDAAIGDGHMPHRYPRDAPDEVVAWACQACGETINETHGPRSTCPVDWRPRDPHALAVALAYLANSP